MFQKSLVRLSVIVVGLGGPPPAAWAHSDVLVANVAGQATLGAAADIDGPTESFDLSTRIFETILRTGFAPPTPTDYEADEPGYFALHGVDDAASLALLGASPLPAGADISAISTLFTVDAFADELFYWSGVGAVVFQPASVVQPGVALAFAPAAFGVTGPHGDLDAHPIYQLNAAIGSPADGVYLAAPRIGVAGLTTSDPFYLVMLVDDLITGEDELEAVESALEALEQGAPDALVDFGGSVSKDFAFYEDAVEWVDANLPVPEPSSACLAIAGLALIAQVNRFGRRRS